MKSDIRLSIIVPIYNGEKYIENTINSILKSSYQNIEVLLIDDGSTDNSLIICEKYAKIDSRIKVFHKENGGIADARNYGVMHTTGEYIGFCDQDDEISSEMYQKMMQRILHDRSQVAICGCCRKKRNGAKVVFEKYTDATFDKQHTREKLMYPMLFKGFSEYNNKEISIYTAIWKCIISKQLIIQNNLKFDGFVNYEDDFIMLLQIFLKVQKVSTLSDILYYWNTNFQSEMHRCNRSYISDLSERQQRLLNFVTFQLEENNVNKEIIEKYKYVQHCRNVLLVLDNFATLRNRKLRYKIGELQNNPSVILLQKEKILVRAEKGFIRNQVIIPLVRKKHIISAYLLNRLIDEIRYFIEKYYIAERLERMIKGC
ncbi:MAG TPA: hypothetical protein DEB74_19240 [Lachnospiraceae bacterium]|nr:hypothetical protein [Lachnospiraceae bacterium]